MITIRPFAALRPKPELAAQICELPYDVMSSDEARQIAKGNPLSFLHVSKPEIDLPLGTSPYSGQVYQQGRENFRRLIDQGALQPDARACLYLYRQIMGPHRQTGLVAVASCDEYLRGIIKKHELTRPDKEDDRVRHLEALDSQTGPVFLVYRAIPAIDDLVAKRCASAPAIDFTAKDGVQHTAWVLDTEADRRLIQEEFARLPALYIADGHHRCAAAARVCQSRRGAGESAFFLSVIFPHNQVQILPYNRALKDLNGRSAQALLEALRSVFTVHPAAADFNGTPGNKHDLGLYLDRSWHRLTFRPELTRVDNPIDKLDVTLLQNHVLGPVFGIDDPRTSKRIEFVGGIRGAAELERLVNSGDCACAFSMFPTGIDDLMEVSDSGGIMPPKSTWFEPKLRDGMFGHMLS